MAEAGAGRATRVVGRGNPRRKAKKPLDAKATRDVVSDYLAWHVVVNGGDSILEALDLEAGYQILNGLLTLTLPYRWPSERFSE